RGRPTHAQAAPKTRLRTEDGRDRQAALLRSRFPAVRTGVPARAGVSQKQSGGELAPGGAATRAQDATVQVSGIGSTLSEYPRRRAQHFQPSTSSGLAVDPADLPSRRSGTMAT